MQMTMNRNATHSRPNAIGSPSYLIEYGLYAILFYGMLGNILGLTFPIIGGGGLMGLAVLCAMHFGARARDLYEPIVFALACVTSAILLQVVIHQESLMDGNVRSYLTWGFLLVIIQALYSRKGFFHRFAIFSFFLGCGTLPYLETYVSTDELTRMGVSHGVGLANPNSFGMWFGFCSVYFIVLGIETQNHLVRVASWSAGLLCIVLVAITVSRGPLLGVAIATVVALKRVLKRSFLPVLIFFFLGWAIYVTGLADDLIGYYMQRGTEESGRSTLWASGFNMFIESWWIGTGVSNSGVPGRSELGTPHNGLLYIGISSGIIPLVFFVWYWARAGFKALDASTQQWPDAPYILPLYLFATLEMLTLDAVFMSPWCMVALSGALTAGRGGPVHPK